MWAADTEGAKFWRQIVRELKNRGVQDIFIACVDGLKGFPEAIEAVYPQTQVQLCMVHLVRHSLSYVSHKDRKQVALDLKTIYHAATLEEAERQLDQFAETRDESYLVIARSWRSNWSRVVPMFGYPSEIRRAVYTTNTYDVAQSEQESLFVSERRGGVQVAVSGIEKYQPEMDNANQELERSDESVCDSF